jgi:hypothetical protein
MQCREGVSLNLDVDFNNGFKFLVGGTFMDVYSVEDRCENADNFLQNILRVYGILAICLEK